jgi:uncharacterized membrane protein
MILTNSNRFRCLKFRHLIYLCMVGIYIFIYDFNKLKPFSVSEIQTPNLSLHGWYLYMILTNSNCFRCLNFRHLIYLCMVGIYIFIYDFNKRKPFSVSEIQTPNLSLHGWYLYMILTNSDRFRCLKFRHLIYLSLHGWYLYRILTNSNRFRCLKFRHLIYLCMVGIYMAWPEMRTASGRACGLMFS